MEIVLVVGQAGGLITSAGLALLGLCIAIYIAQQPGQKPLRQGLLTGGALTMGAPYFKLLLFLTGQEQGFFILYTLIGGIACVLIALHHERDDEGKDT